MWSGSNTPSGSFGEGDVAVAVHSATGDVYVADKTHAVIDKFDSNGNLIASFGDTENGITHTPEPNGQLTGLETPAGSFSPASHSLSVLAIAVNQATGELYAIDAGHKVIDVFSSSGAYLRQITATPAACTPAKANTPPGSRSIRQRARLFASWGTRQGQGLPVRFTGTYVSAWDGETLPNGSASEVPGGTFGCGTCALISVATEDSTGHVIISGYSTLNVFDSTGDFIPPQLTLSQAASTGLALRAVDRRRVPVLRQRCRDLQTADPGRRHGAGPLRRHRKSRRAERPCGSGRWR